MDPLNRRNFLGAGLILGASTLLGKETSQKIVTESHEFVPPTIAFPEKKPLKVISDRPPLLESPRDIFTRAITPNDQFFVRWHMPDIPTYIDLNEFRLQVQGAVETPLSLSVDDLKSKFEPVEITSVLQCGGNSRKYYAATGQATHGVQWGHGAMGCAIWKGVRLKDILNRAGVKGSARFVGVNGLEKPAVDETPKFFREMEIDEALSGEIIVAYSMNGEDLPYLNGFPLRLVIPGHFSDSWVKMLSEITVMDQYRKSFFMDVAYTVPDNDCECVISGSDFEYKRKPIAVMKVKSVIGYPTPNTIIKKGSRVKVTGVAFDQGKGIKEVMISVDGGKSWSPTALEKDYGKFAYRPWTFVWEPKAKGEYTIMVRAINRIGNIQPLPEDIGWNAGGYQYNAVDSVNVKIV
ncbi:MAG: molybdopterin-dependent oxidoreductase [Sulfuricurvum sp.]|jgi:sulfoxide reductase catalytic subunit YedY|uniref:molybdopterin-dependent oxidoreductase n=1 Tax=Sulfuricurvum sp. TaxID=2025608 RepID=UPI0025D8C5F1|nr:molybdopterin-dependent oxidoreductase [Sulfuricurvum sp.]MCK9372828.1 molybdopterin-dependent oxidoreductase [Sulfuricurvum sp.]